MELKGKFVIMCVDHSIPDGAVFVGIDYMYDPYWTDFQSAEFFTYSEAERIVNNSDFTSDSRMYDGTIFPPRMIQSGANLSYAKKVGTITISIVPVVLGEPTFTKTITASIKKPKGFTY